MRSKVLDAIIPLSRVPDEKRPEWLENAEDSVAFLQKNLKSDEILLYASGPHFYVHSVLAPTDLLKKPDHNDLQSGNVMLDNCWRIQKVYGGGQGHRVFLEPPMIDSGSNILKGGEKLVFVRQFMGMKDFNPPVELSQKLVHALDVHYLDERNAYCRLDDKGDLVDVIVVSQNDTHDPWQRVRAVTIKGTDLATYMALSRLSLVSYFDFTRTAPGGFSGWGNGGEQVFQASDFYYRHRKLEKHASYANGHAVLRTKLSVDDLVDDWKASEDKSAKKYASFKIIDRKNDNALIETSCSPDHIVNYFTESDLPWELSPAFFRSEVLQKYKSDTEKYTFEDRSISCRNSWYLKTYDINEAGQVHTYIGYLADLPYEEQLYWQSFNEWPEADISERARQTDIRGEFSTVSDPLHSLKALIQKLDRENPSWWSTRGDFLLDAANNPVTDSVDEWGNEILALDHLAVEGFSVKELKKIVKQNGGEVEKEWGSLKSLEVALSLTGRTEEQAKAAVSPLRELHLLRNPLRAHGNPSKRREETAKARKQFSTLRSHYIDLVSRLEVSYDTIIATLPK